MQTIKAAVCHEFGAPLVIEDIQLAAPGMGQVEVTLNAVAICHSDIHYAEGGWGGTLPAVYGHEAAGVVSSVGAGVTGFAEGDSVVVTLIRACGTCPNCASGKPTICETPVDGQKGPIRTMDGGPLDQALACGAFAEKVVVIHNGKVAVSGPPKTAITDEMLLNIYNCPVQVNVPPMDGIPFVLPQARVKP